MPMTEPPEKAIDSALFMPLSMAAFAVRTLARVATRMPKKPAAMEKIAPIRKQIAVPRSIKIEIRAKSTTINIARIRYSDIRKAFAPSAIADAISCMRALPAGARDT